MTSRTQQLEHQIEMLEMSVRALQFALKSTRKRSAKRLETIRRLKRRVADLLNQNHRLEALGPSRFRRHGLRGEGE